MCLRKRGDSCPHVVCFCTSGHRLLSMLMKLVFAVLWPFFPPQSCFLLYCIKQQIIKCFTASPMPLTLFPLVFQMPVPGCPSVPCHPGLCCPPLPLRHGHAAEDELQRPRGAATGAAGGGLLHRDGNRWVPEGLWGEFEAFVPSEALTQGFISPRL